LIGFYLENHGKPPFPPKVDIKPPSQKTSSPLCQEEALVAFTGPKDLAQRLQRDLGDHFRCSREDVVQPQKVGMRAQKFASYIVAWFSCDEFQRFNSS